MKLSFIIPIIFLIISPFAAYADTAIDTTSKNIKNHYTKFTSSFFLKTLLLGEKNLRFSTKYYKNK